MDRGAWQVTVHGVTKHWTWLSTAHTATVTLYSLKGREAYILKVRVPFVDQSFDSICGNSFDSFDSICAKMKIAPMQMPWFKWESRILSNFWWIFPSPPSFPWTLTALRLLSARGPDHPAWGIPLFYCSQSFETFPLYTYLHFLLWIFPLSSALTKIECPLVDIASSVALFHHDWFSFFVGPRDGRSTILTSYCCFQSIHPTSYLNKQMHLCISCCQILPALYLFSVIYPPESLPLTP